MKRPRELEARPAVGLGQNDSKQPKRVNDGLSPIVSVTSSTTKTIEDLSKICIFDQTVQAAEIANRLESFVGDLISIRETTDLQERRSLLTRYFISYTTRISVKGTGFPDDLLRCWRFSVQSNDHRIYIATATCIACLLSASSDLVELRSYGAALCCSLLDPNNVPCFEKALGVTKGNESLSESCLRLLSELMAFDGGVCAQKIYARRTTFLPNLSKLLDVTPSKGHGRLSLRSPALQFLLSYVKLQSRHARLEILRDHQIIKAVFFGIGNDKPCQIKDTLTVFQEHVLSDENISCSDKRRIFDASLLKSLVSLYKYRDDDYFEGARCEVSQTLHRFLVAYCNAAVPEIYADGEERKLNESESTSMAAGGASAKGSYSLFKRANRSIRRDGGIVSLLQTLRPHQHNLERDLLLHILHLNPNIITAYSRVNRSTAPDPKLTASSMGYLSLWLGIIQMPFQLHTLAQTDDVRDRIAITVNSIVPNPLNRYYLTRCINQSVQLLSFLGVRLVIASMQKLLRLLQITAYTKYQQAGGASLTLEMITEIKSKVYHRLPDMSSVMAAFHRCTAQSSVQKESLAHLLGLYYTVNPRNAFHETFEISRALNNILSSSAAKRIRAGALTISYVTLDHLLRIASVTPDINWWARPDPFSRCPFMQIVLFAISGSGAKNGSMLRGLLKTASNSINLLNEERGFPAIAIFLESLGARHHHPQRQHVVHDFVENCIVRFAKAPVRYHDALDELSSLASSKISGIGDGGLSPLLMTILEQLPRAANFNTGEDCALVYSWLAGWIKLSLDNGGDQRFHDVVIHRICGRHAPREVASHFNVEFYRHDTTSFSSALLRSSLTISENHLLPVDGTVLKDTLAHGDVQRAFELKADVAFGGEVTSASLDGQNVDFTVRSHVELLAIIEDGSLEGLIRCLCSEHEAIRKQALISLRYVRASVLKTDQRFKIEYFLALGELIDSAERAIHDSPLPHFVAIIASRSLTVLLNPTHFLYTKINEFFNKGPHWDIQRLPAYWMDRILLQRPADSDASYKEIRWLLDNLFDGLQAYPDIEIYRKCHVFERVLSLMASPMLRDLLKEKILQLLARATYVQGSTSIITRSSLLSWAQVHKIHSRIDRQDIDGSIVEQLMRRSFDTCDQERVSVWSEWGFARSLEVALRA